MQVKQKQASRYRQTLTLNPLTFDEAVTDILKIKPEPKKKPKVKKRDKASKN